MATKKGSRETTSAVDIHKLVDASMQAGIIKGETTIREVVDFVQRSRLRPSGYVIAWSKYVAVIK